jgi:hypothetical protein
MDGTVTGSFVGDDANKDGVLQLEELSAFSLLGSRFLPPELTGEVLGCIPEPDPRVCEMWSGLSQFSYATSTGDLQAAGVYPGYDYRVVFRIGESIVAGSRQAVETYQWTASTTVTVTPVPEPGTAAQALLGLALLAGSLWRRATAGAGPRDACGRRTRRPGIPSSAAPPRA